MDTILTSIAEVITSSHRGSWDSEERDSIWNRHSWWQQGASWPVQWHDFGSGLLIQLYTVPAVFKFFPAGLSAT